MKWSLRPGVRSAVLKEAIGTDALGAALERTASRASDGAAAYLRQCLVDDDRLPVMSRLSDLESARIAVGWLSGVEKFKVPSLEDLDREIELARLLAPFEHMVGHDPDALFPSGEDLFVGREKQMERLRGYVGVIPADSIVSSATRAAASLFRTLRGQVPLVVWGPGGMGKTTLISKFMLEHARAATSHYPFAYLDFDRTTITAGQRPALLAEMCQQVGAQFPQLTARLAQLRSRVMEMAAESAGDFEEDSISRLRPYLREFRGLIDGSMQSLESGFETARPFLLVFDTFEVVQYSPDDVTALEEFVAGFADNPEGTKLWPRMRLVISGRARIREFLENKVEQIPLTGLDAKSSTALLRRLVSSAGMALSDSAAISIVALVSRNSAASKDGISPLRLRLLGKALTAEQEAGRSLLSSLDADLKENAVRGMDFDALIDGILVRRIINHVADPRVRALADPGLVVRRITPAVIQKVMSAGTSGPDNTAEAPDAEIVKPWSLSEEEALDIFHAFQREVSLVLVEGASLRHRPDVRREMLPLIRARRPKRFRRLQELAFQYFQGQLKEWPNDKAAADETIYHGLWLGVDIEELNRIWVAAGDLHSRIDPDEFPSTSIQNRFLRAKMAHPMQLPELRELPTEIAVDWVCGRSDLLLKRKGIYGRDGGNDLESILALVGEDFERLDGRWDAIASLARLLYRAGQWSTAARLIARSASLPWERLGGRVASLFLAADNDPESKVRIGCGFGGSANSGC